VVGLGVSDSERDPEGMGNCYFIKIKINEK